MAIIHETLYVSTDYRIDNVQQLNKAVPGRRGRGKEGYQDETFDLESAN
jgi:hypothetical protein